MWPVIDSMQLNLGNTKQMVLNLQDNIQPVSIYGSDIELVPQYKYLGVQLTDQLDWDEQRRDHEETPIQVRNPRGSLQELHPEPRNLECQHSLLSQH